jgi:predicted dehydrogenase
VRERLADGALGRLQAVEVNLGEHIADYHPGEAWRHSYVARADLGGGVLLTQIHEFDYLNWLFGPFASVYAVGGSRTSLALDVEDSVSVLMRSVGGTPVYAHLDYVQAPKRHALVLIGECGRLEWSYFDNRVTWQPAEPGAVAEHDAPAFDRNAMFLDCMADFLAAVRDRRPPRSTLQDGLAALALVDAVKRSMKTDKVVRPGLS